MKFVDITNDIAFRKIFGNESKKKSLISFLNAVIDFPKNEQVVDVEITNPYQLGKLSGGKSTIVDVKAKDKKGNIHPLTVKEGDRIYFGEFIYQQFQECYLMQEADVCGVIDARA